MIGRCCRCAEPELAAPEQPYALDLDLLGRASLFQLLDGVGTWLGERTLRLWLLAPAQPAVVGARQEAVAELAPLVDLRDELTWLAGPLARSGWTPRRSWPGPSQGPGWPSGVGCSGRPDSVRRSCWGCWRRSSRGCWPGRCFCCRSVSTSGSVNTWLGGRGDYSAGWGAQRPPGRLCRGVGVVGRVIVRGACPAGDPGADWRRR